MKSEFGLSAAILSVIVLSAEATKFTIEGVPTCEVPNASPYVKVTLKERDVFSDDVYGDKIITTSEDRTFSLHFNEFEFGGVEPYLLFQHDCNPAYWENGYKKADKLYCYTEQRQNIIPGKEDLVTDSTALIPDKEICNENKFIQVFSTRPKRAPETTTAATTKATKNPKPQPTSAPADDEKNKETDEPTQTPEPVTTTKSHKKKPTRLPSTKPPKPTTTKAPPTTESTEETEEPATEAPETPAPTKKPHKKHTTTTTTVATPPATATTTPKAASSEPPTPTSPPTTTSRKTTEVPTTARPPPTTTSTTTTLFPPTTSTTTRPTTSTTTTTEFPPTTEPEPLDDITSSTTAD